MTLEWERFRGLAGDPKHNLELLCRALVQRNYGHCGRICSRRQQPGVEFYLSLDRDCPGLGAAGHCFGWQCRYYQLPPSHALTTKQRDEITKAIEMAAKYVKGLTDFVLVLPELPKSSDIDWYNEIKTDLRLQLWSDEELDARLTGNAEILRETYFGELIITPEQLADAHARTIEPIKQRWVPEMHVTTATERQLRTALARPENTEPLDQQAVTLRRLAGELREGTEEIPDGELRTLADRAAEELDRQADRVTGILDAYQERRPGDARALVLEEAPVGIALRDVRTLARGLAARRLPVALTASAVEGEIRFTRRSIKALRPLTAASMLAIIGDAGSGKTELAAQLTAPATGTQAGILLRGVELTEHGTLDELAQRVPGLNLNSFDELLAAADAAGARGGVRLPLVIDGLNEAERPARWQTLLSELTPILHRYEHLLVVVTLRGMASDEMLPDEVLKIELDWREVEIAEAIARYFEHYKLERGSTRLPFGLFSHPLMLRIYCEAVNPGRAAPVGVESLPFSLVGVFGLYIERTVARLNSRPGHPALAPGEIERRLAELARAVWEGGTRELPFESAREILDADEKDWGRSLLRALEEDGLLYREQRSVADQRVAILFDRLAGYLIATALIATTTVQELEAKFASQELWERLTTKEQDHPLAEDTFVALAGVLPRHGQQLWCLAPQNVRDWALAQTLGLESRYLDEGTLDALAELIPRLNPPRGESRHAFDRLWEVRDGPNHKLNASFLDRVLQGMSIAERDLRWSEWVRARTNHLASELAGIEARWAATDARDERDEFDATAITWLLTSTVRSLRDSATRALQRYGRGDPAGLFKLASAHLDVNDPYVSERILAACFGAASSHQMPDPGGTFEQPYKLLLEELARRYLCPDAQTPTSHILTRDYVSCCFQIAAQLHPAVLPTGINPEQLDFAAAPAPGPIVDEDERAAECERTMRMDFRNYTVGGLYDGRANYQTDHAGYQAGLAEIRGRVWELGWREATFSDPDETIGRDQWRRHDTADKTERYGKKYTWIAYYELAGRLQDSGELRDRLWISPRPVWPDIDPSFPEGPASPKIMVPAWASSDPADDPEWYSAGRIEIPEELLLPNEQLTGKPGAWVLVEGYLQHKDGLRSRRVFGFLRGVLLAAADAKTLATMLSERPYLGNHYVPEAPNDPATFAGEIPWSHSFEAHGNLENGLALYHALVQEDYEQPGVEIELLAHGYDVALDRTTTAVATGHWVPSATFARAFDLRRHPHTLDLICLDGSMASLTRDAPAGFEGKLLYLRRDLLASYAGDRLLLHLAWGERQVDFDFANPPGWLEKAGSEHSDIWRHVRVRDLAGPKPEDSETDG